MTWPAVQWAFTHGPDTPHDMLVLVALAEYCDERGYCFPSIKTLAQRCRMSEQGVRKSIKRLSEEGYLSVTTGGWKEGSNRYQIIKKIRKDINATPAQHAGGNPVQGAGNGVQGGPAPGADEPTNEPTSKVEETSSLLPVRGEVVLFPTGSKAERQPKARPVKRDAQVLQILCAALPEETAHAWLDHRRAIRKPFTDQAARIMAKKLAALPDPVAVVEQSIASGWTGIYPERQTETPATKDPRHGKRTASTGLFNVARRIAEQDAADARMAGREDRDPPLSILP